MRLLQLLRRRSPAPAPSPAAPRRVDPLDRFTNWPQVAPSRVLTPPIRREPGQTPPPSVVPARARPRAGYDITDDKCPDWHVFKADASVRGYEVHLQVWHRGEYGQYADVFLRRRTDDIVVPLDTATLHAHGTGVWDVIDGWADVYALAMSRAVSGPGATIVSNGTTGGPQSLAAASASL